MVKSIGIDPGDQAVKVVELDGSYKKTRLVRVHSAPAGAISPDGGTQAEVVAAAARAAIDLGMRGDVVLGHPCREAVLRVIELPFRGHEAIRKVVKTEIEGEIYSQVVDDMIVDFLEIGEGFQSGTRVLVGAVPKAGLRSQLNALRGREIEPESIDLDTLALWRAAHWAGAFAVGEGEEAPAADAVTVVVDLGARSIKVLLVEGEKLIEMRALRIGDAVVAVEVAQRHGLDVGTARDVVQRCLTSGADQRLEVPDAVPAVTGEGEPAPAEPTSRTIVVTHAEVESSHTAFLQRLARELTRFLTASGVASRLRAVWVTGGGSKAPGIADMLSAVFGVEARDLDVLSRLQHDLTPEEVEEYGPRLSTAIGLALTPMGGPVGFQLRQEDLLLTRGFERIKFPLAIACMVALLALLVFVQKRTFELKLLEREIGATWVNPDPTAPPVFFGMLNHVMAGKWFENKQYFYFERPGQKDYSYKDLLAELAEAPVARRLQIVRDRVKAVADAKQKESGVYEDVAVESGLAVLVRFSRLLKACEPQLGRFLVPRLSLTMKAPNRRLEFTIAVTGEDFRSRFLALQRAIEADIQGPDSPFAQPKRADEFVKETPFTDLEKTGVAGAYFKVVVAVKDSFQPFGALGAADRPSSVVPAGLETSPTRPGVLANAEVR